MRIITKLRTNFKKGFKLKISNYNANTTFGEIIVIKHVSPLGWEYRKLGRIKSIYITMEEIKMLKLPSHLSYGIVSKQLKNRIEKLFKKNKIKVSHFIPQKVNIVHAIPGRIRLQCNQWKNEKVSQSLEFGFKAYPLVDRVSVSPISGTLLLELKVLHLTKEQFNQLVQHAVDSAHPHKEVSYYFKTFKKIINKKGKSLLEKLD